MCRYLSLSGSLHSYSFLSSHSYFNLLKVTIPYGFKTSSLLQTYRKLSCITYLKVSRRNSSLLLRYSGIISCCSGLRDNLATSVFPKNSHSKSSIQHYHPSQKLLEIMLTYKPPSFSSRLDFLCTFYSDYQSLLEPCDFSHSSVPASFSTSIWVEFRPKSARTPSSIFFWSLSEIWNRLKLPKCLKND